MSDRRVRGSPPAGNTPTAAGSRAQQTRPSLIEYAPPATFQQSIASPSASAAARPPSSTSSSHPSYPTRPPHPSHANPFDSGSSLYMSPSSSENEMDDGPELPLDARGEVALEEMDVDVGEEEEEDEFDEMETGMGGAGSSGRRTTRKPHSRFRSHLSKGGSELLKGFATGGEKVIAALRGEVDDGPLVEDHILESMNFDREEDYVNEDSMEKRHAIHRHATSLLQFLLTVLIAFITAMLMFIVHHGVETLHEFKLENVHKLLEHDNDAGAYFLLLAIALLYTLIGSCLVAVVAPDARAGGVPFVMAYLNGTNVMEQFSLRIVLVKSIALIFTIGGGLTLGQEGPFVFIGGGVAAILLSALDIAMPFFPKRSAVMKFVRSIREERIFMAGGMAAGLAVAFDAPIAGVLFALEGATAFLSAPIVLRIFGCAMFASFFNNLGHTNFSHLIKNHNLLQVSNSGEPSEFAWNLLEIFPFILIAVIGGVVGAMATRLNVKMFAWRHHSWGGTSGRDVLKQVGEVLLMTMATVTFFFVLPYIYGCRPKHDLCDVMAPGLPSRCTQAHCPEGEYSEIGTIVYATANQISALLFDRSLSWEAEFHAAPLLTYGAIYWLLVSVMYGIYVPGGLFVPSIVIGGVYGRVVGIACKAIFPVGIHVNPGVYSLLGAASMLGGFTRLALPVVLMLIELTGDATYLLLIMFCSVVAKFLSDYIEPPLYPQHMAMEGIPSLTDKVNPEIAKLTARDIMIGAEKCQTMCTIERLSDVKNLLATSRRIVFPLITPDGHLAGLILRRKVMYCVLHSPTYKTFEEAEAQSHRDRQEELAVAERHMPDWRQDRRDYASTLTKGRAELEDAFLNFTPFLDSGVITARPETPGKRLAALFRRVGLSHLCITDKNNIFQGLITRRCLITPPAQRQQQLKQQQMLHQQQQQQQQQSHGGDSHDSSQWGEDGHAEEERYAAEEAHRWAASHPTAASVSRRPGHMAPRPIAEAAEL